ncbi:hypothetical protein H4Q32_029604 [Labeo rohita]|uniref:Vitelline membrane outer layer 1-like protein n=1 Tax=Labeo rohita TaxID=84645 RepID=A0ABQ8L160_LABRO|nr:hypothetical protein H4Q32_029604 [Labeo rohita]
MNHFISMMFSLLVFIGLQVSVESLERSTNRGYISELTVSNGGTWGSWGNKEMCPDGTYAAGFSLKVEADGTSDNTALNGIRLHCLSVFHRLSNSFHDEIPVQSGVGSWGQWTDVKWCSSGFLRAFMMRVKPIKAGTDNTAVNNIVFQCNDGVVMKVDATDSGDWGKWSKTCEGKGICGLKTRVQGLQGSGDDTALNDVVLEDDNKKIR